MEKGFFSTTQVRILGSLVLFMALIAIASYASLNFEKGKFVNPMPPTISVTGEGEVLTVPDIGQFSFSVTAEGGDASIAQEASGTKINDILAYLREQGIEEKDVKTQNYNLYPKWRFEERVCQVGSYCPPGERVQDGFEVTQTVSVKVRDTAKAPTIIGGVGEKGATNISSLNFTIDDMEVLRTEAREKAIKDAQTKAVLLAEQLGVRVVRFVSFYEDSGSPQPFYLETRAMALDDSGGFNGPELPVGEESTKVRVNVTYEVE